MDIDGIREAFVDNYEAGKFAENKTLEIVGASFDIYEDDETIFGAVNQDYIERELEWYESKSLYVSDIPGGTPKIWDQVSSKHGRINSNYGWMVFSEENFNQYANVLKTLAADLSSRQAVAIYTRPTMHRDSTHDGMRDFACTNAVQYLVRDNKLEVVVQMRSNDAVFGFRNDLAWQRYVQQRLLFDLQSETSLDLEIGKITWQVGSLHIYPRHYKLVEHYLTTGEHDAPVS